MTSPTDLPATGRREQRDGVDQLVLERTFRAPIDDVWAAVTDPVRMVRWIGTWTGDPAAGEVAFRMTAEGEDVAVEVYDIEVCEPPRRLVVRTRGPVAGAADVWQLSVDLHEAESTTTLRFAQVITEAMRQAGTAAEIGPGWEYYLDRLVALQDGRAVTDVVWDAYYPGQSASYVELFTRAT